MRSIVGGERLHVTVLKCPSTCTMDGVSYVYVYVSTYRTTLFSALWMLVDKALTVPNSNRLNVGGSYFSTNKFLL
jgi:hypothetical protein